MVDAVVVKKKIIKIMKVIVIIFSECKHNELFQ